MLVPQVGIFAALSRDVPKAKCGDQSLNDTDTDGESTCVGSDRDVIDLTDTSDSEWQSVRDFENKMEIEYEEYQPPPPQKPKGFFQQT